MNSMSRDLARMIGAARALEGPHRRLVDDARRARRDERRAARETKRAARTGGSPRPWWHRGEGGVRPVTLAAAPEPRPEDVTAELERLLGELAVRVAEHGTEAEGFALQAVAEASRWTSPGAAAALVDREGAEAARLRAFGVLHGVVLGNLGHQDRAWLLDRLSGTGSAESDGRVA